MSYYPAKHTIAWNVMELFKSKPAATRLGTGAIADALDQPRESILPCIKPCIENRLLNKVIENGITYFELGEAAYKPVKIRLGKNDLPAELLKELRPEQHLPPSLRALDDENEDVDSYDPPPVVLAKDNHPERLPDDPDRADPPAEKKDPVESGYIKDSAVVDLAQTRTDKALIKKLEKAVAEKKKEDATQGNARTVSENLMYSYHSNGSVTISKAGQQVTLTVEDCLVVAKFINAVDTFERVKKFAAKQK